jgi:hypothetical protein
MRRRDNFRIFKSGESDGSGSVRKHPERRRDRAVFNRFQKSVSSPIRRERN